jgi:hypothetical protein
MNIIKDIIKRKILSSLYTCAKTVIQCGRLAKKATSALFIITEISPGMGKIKRNVLTA